MRALPPHLHDEAAPRVERRRVRRHLPHARVPVARTARVQHAVEPAEGLVHRLRRVRALIVWAVDEHERGQLVCGRGRLGGGGAAAALLGRAEDGEEVLGLEVLLEHPLRQDRHLRAGRRQACARAGAPMSRRGWHD
eukprot:1834759-Prymnesium_polylepis.1